MANANTPKGLLPYRHFDGRAWNGAVNMYYASASYATALYIGDPLIMSSTYNATDGTPGVTIATAGAANLIVGTMVGIVSGGDPIIAVTRDLPIYRPASVAQYILVADDPDLLFWMQEDSVGGSMTYANTGNNANIISGSGSTTTGYSGWLLDSSTAATGNATYQVKILRPLAEADNTIGSSYAKWLVKINQHQMANGTVGT